VDDANAQAIVADLKRVGAHTIIVGTLMNNDEASRYANRLISIFRAGGWDLPGSQPEVSMMSAPAVGIYFQAIKDEPIPTSANQLAAIFKAHHIDYNPDLWPVTIDQLKTPKEPAEFKIFVGSNPAAEIK
jgi:hypothetical protein